jgi:hypothetical protein
VTNVDWGLAMYCFRRGVIVALTVGMCLLLSLGCAKKVVKGEGDLKGEESSRTYQSEIKEPPSYDLLARSLDYVEKQQGIQFRRNEKGSYFPFSANAWNHFTIADASNNCLYDVQFTHLRSFQQLGKGFQTILNLEVTKGPCGLTSANLNIGVLDRLQHLEGAVISAKLVENMEKGTNFISDMAFIQKTLQAPYELHSSLSAGLEPYLNERLERVVNPLDVAFGDIMIFSEQFGEYTLGIYVGYGLLVTNCCFRTEVRKMSSEVEYHVYRLYAGFAQVNYKVHHDEVLHRMLSNP